MNIRIRGFWTPIGLALALALGTATPAMAAPGDSGMAGPAINKQQLHNAWLKGKLETVLLLNPHLNSFAIKSVVEDGKATLSGAVESDIDRDLAGELALSIEGINEVDNRLIVGGAAQADSEAQGASRSGLAERLRDLTTTAEIKTKLLNNPNTSGLQINVDTENLVVTLSGVVASSEEKQLAELISANTKHVRSVENKLTVAN